MQLLKDRIAFVTGSSRGIGWAIARTFAQHGATVVLNGHSNAERLESRLRELQSRHGNERAISLFFDVADVQQVRSAFQTIFKRYGRLDVLVNNAGILNDGLLGMLSDETIKRTFDVNTVAVAHCTQCAARLMSRAKSGSIINISSIMGINGNEGEFIYSGSKAALIGMTKSSAKELAALNIRVNAIAPGFIDTDLTRQLSPQKFEERLASIKLKRIGQPDDVASAALFLASELSSYVTGQILGVDGGMLV